MYRHRVKNRRTGIVKSEGGGGYDVRECVEMIEHPARGRRWLSWSWVVIWSLAIFATIPLARVIQTFVSGLWGRQAFTYAAITTILTALTVAAAFTRRHRPTSRGYIWLVGTAAIFIAYSLELGKQYPEEAVHFIQYGVLGVVVYRALTHSIRDASIYFMAAIICGAVGIGDELIQWLTPKRYWDLRDIWINFFAAALVQVAIACGLRPTFIRLRPSRTNLRRLCLMAVLTAIQFGACLLIPSLWVAFSHSSHMGAGQTAGGMAAVIFGLMLVYKYLDKADHKPQ